MTGKRFNCKRASFASSKNRKISYRNSRLPFQDLLLNLDKGLLGQRTAMASRHVARLAMMDLNGVARDNRAGAGFSRVATRTTRLRC